MALGDSIRALKIVSKAKGWDPDLIQGVRGENGKDYPSASMLPFNKAPNTNKEHFGDIICGDLPGYPESPQEQDGQNGTADNPILQEKVTFNAPSQDREYRVRNKGESAPGNPYPGKPGAA